VRIDTVLLAEARTANDDSRLVPWWSFTKTLLAAAALTLVSQRKLQLDAPLEGASYTLRHLLQHTTGLRDYGAVPDYHAAVAAAEEPWSREELLRRAKADALLFAPGTAWAYSNIGYLYVRELVEGAVDADLQTALNTLVVRPLGITGAFVASTREDWDRTLWGGARGYHPGWVYHGLVVGSPSAAATLLHRLLFSDAMPPALRAEMLTPLLIGGAFQGRPAVAPGYGLGLMIDTASPLGRVVGHTDQGPGSTWCVYSMMDLREPRTLAAFVPEDRYETQGLLEEHMQEVISSSRDVDSPSRPVQRPCKEYRKTAPRAGSDASPTEAQSSRSRTPSPKHQIVD
jgi:D-alanyl-D-alanine carboxypeptidase